MNRRLAAGLKVLAVLVTMGPPSAAAPKPSAPSVSVVGTTFKVTLADGRILPQRALVGVRFALGDSSGRQRQIRIDAVVPDPKDRSGAVRLYTLSEQDARGTWHNACQPDPDGRRLGFPLAGRFTADGRYVDAPGRLLITCTGGAEGKCIRFGYHPWQILPNGTSLRDAYNACVRLVRADYVGDGHGTTRNGQPIDIYDAFGIQPPAADPAYEFEAGWTAAGAVCVRHVRVKQNTSLAAIAAASPRLAGRLGKACTEGSARATGAILFVRSPP